MRVLLSIAAAGALFVPAMASAQLPGGQAGGGLSGIVDGTLDAAVRIDAADRAPALRDTRGRTERAPERAREKARKKAYDSKRRIDATMRTAANGMEVARMGKPAPQPRG